MPRPFAPGRVGLKQFLVQAGISKNTFFLRYRYEPRFVRLLDIQEDRDHRLHFPAEAGQRLRELRGKPRHGNAGRAPQRPCPSCGATLHPRHVACIACGWEATVHGRADERARTSASRSTAMMNYRRSEELEALRRSANPGRAHWGAGAGSVSDMSSHPPTSVVVPPRHAR